MPAKKPEQPPMDKELLKTIRVLEHDLELCDARIRVLEAEQRDDRAKIETLKAMLTASEQEAAFRRGYLERVREDDTVRETITEHVTRQEVQAHNPRETRNYSGPMVADHDPGPGRRMMGALDRAEMGGRPETWRDKPWSQW